VALHLEQVDAWVRGHTRLIVTLTVVAALAAEGLYFLAAHGVTSVLGPGYTALFPGGNSARPPADRGIRVAPECITGPEVARNE
jgi:hypothetical protein